MSADESESIKNFLLENQKKMEKQENKKTYSEGLGHFVTSLKNKNANNNSIEDYKNIARKTIFITGGLMVLDQVSGFNLFGSAANKIYSGIDTTLSPFTPLLEKERVNNAGNNMMADMADSVYNIGKEFKDTQMLKNGEITEIDLALIKLSISFNEYFDTNKIDFHQILDYAKLFGTGSFAIYGASALKNSKLAEEIALYSETGTDLRDHEKISYAKNQNADIQTEAVIRNSLSKTFHEMKVEHWMSGIVGDMIKHITSPKKSAQKTWLYLNIGKNNILSAFNLDPVKRLEYQEANIRIKNKIKNLRINDYKESLSVIKNDNFFNKRPNDFNVHKGIANASLKAYESVLKSNVKNSLSKSLFILGSKDKSKEEKKEALSILNKVAVLNSKTNKNNFNDFEVISLIAKKEIEKIKLNSNGNLNNLCMHFENFKSARSYVNNRQKEHLNSLAYKLEDGTFDFQKSIPNKVDYNYVFLDLNIPTTMKNLKEKVELEDKMSQNKARNENSLLKNRERQRP